jgi:hypothetical protein
MSEYPVPRRAAAGPADRSSRNAMQSAVLSRDEGFHFGALRDHRREAMTVSR